LSENQLTSETACVPAPRELGHFSGESEAIASDLHAAKKGSRTPPPGFTVYAFEWCSCIYESEYSVVSLHATKRCAVKAMVQKANARCLQARNDALEFGVWEKNYLSYERWRVREIALLP
jgi:hypothetical protein